jgi:glutathione S-transferase-like protein
MKLYVCYGTWKPAPRPGGHPCGVAYHALRDAGYDPEVKLTYGLGMLPGALNDMSPGRREVKRLTGNYWVPVLVRDDGEVIQGSREIADWARSHPAATAPQGAGAS